MHLATSINTDVLRDVLVQYEHPVLVILHLKE